MTRAHFVVIVPLALVLLLLRFQDAAWTRYLWMPIGAMIGAALASLAQAFSPGPTAPPAKAPGTVWSRLFMELATGASTGAMATLIFFNLLPEGLRTSSHFQMAFYGFPAGFISKPLMQKFTEPLVRVSFPDKRDHR